MQRPYIKSMYVWLIGVVHNQDFPSSSRTECAGLGRRCSDYCRVRVIYLVAIWSRDHDPNVAELHVVFGRSAATVRKGDSKVGCTALVNEITWKIGDEVDLERCSDSALNDIRN